MKRLVMFLMMVSSGALLFVSGCGKQNNQPTQAYTDPGKTSGPAESRGANDLGSGAFSTTLKPVAQSPPSDSGIQGTFTLSNTREPGEEFVVDGPGGEPGVTLSGGVMPATVDGSATNSQETVRSPDGSVYVGGLKGGEPNGQGIYTDPHGTHQEGEFRDGKPYRLTGIWVSADGVKEDGAWNFDGSKSGGTIRWPDGRVYRGEWKNMDGVPEVPDGVGAMAWPDGRKYMGEFHSGKMDGTGQMKHPDGKTQEGVWRDGKFTGSAP